MRGFLLDTTAISELARQKANAGLVAWLSAHDAADTFLAAPCIGELAIGIALMEHSKKRRSLEGWLEKLIREFDRRILPFDTQAALLWGRAVGDSRKGGRSLPTIDSQIAAIASTRGLALVTHNVRHFKSEAFPGLEVVDPWR